jgi:hypothetical protein
MRTSVTGDADIQTYFCNGGFRAAGMPAFAPEWARFGRKRNDRFLNRDSRKLPFARPGWCDLFRGILFVAAGRDVPSRQLRG